MKPITILLLFLFSSRALAQEGIALVKGRIENVPSVHSVKLTCIVNGRLQEDSVILTERSFTLRCSVPEPTYAMLTFNYILPEPGEDGSPESRRTVPLFLERGNISVLMRDSLANVTITGSKAHEEWTALMERARPVLRDFHIWQKTYTATRAAVDFDHQRMLLRARLGLDSTLRDRVYGAYLEERPESPIAGWVVQSYANCTTADPKRILSFIERLPRRQKGSPSVQALQARYNEAIRVGYGKPVRDFSVMSPDGKPVALSSLRGKWVLIDFWASWCRPCRMESINLREAMRLYGEKNFTILGISLDKRADRDEWLQAIADDKMTWPQGSDLSGFDAYPAKMFNVRSIPQNFLVSPEGVIVAFNLRGQNLLHKLAEYLQAN
ncbi:MAG: AhpC/TSA family protein [Chitinophagaceae bacterium]|nr:MAG: AhpC/TSA family protein [Chitinophagaceae bacterium]